jgi:hypothetical protein
VALNETELRDVINNYLQNPETDRSEQEKFIRDEVTFTDGTAGKHTGEFLVSLLDKTKPEDFR